MIPSLFVLLHELPLTPSGKVDRHALPDPGTHRMNSDIVYVPPRTKTERRIVEIWKEVLKVGKVGTSDNFFDLGGQSLLLVRVNSKLKAEFGCDLPLIEMFKYPTVKSLAQRIGRQDQETLVLQSSYDRATFRKTSMRLLGEKSTQPIDR